MGLGEPHAVSALHGVGTAELLEDMFEGIIEKGSAIKGFGTKVKEMEAAQQALMALDKAEPLEGEDETDVFLRLYGVGRDGDDVIKRYEEAMSAFDDVPTMVSVNEENSCIQLNSRTTYTQPTTITAYTIKYNIAGGSQYCNCRPT